MKAMLLEKPNSLLKLHDLPIPEPGDHQVRIKVKTCALCRTDLHIIDEEIPLLKSPLILGHQVIGTVDKLGSHCKKFKQEDRVGVAWLAKSCGHCYFCTHHQENLCDHADFTGYSINGGLAEYAIANEAFIFPVPQGYSSASAAPLFCAGLVGFRSYKKVREGIKLGFYGFGSSAHLLIQIALHEKKEVYAFTRKGDTKTQKNAQELGARWVGDSETSPPDLLDGVIIFASVGELVPIALKHVRKGGIVVCAGIHMTDIPSFPYSLLWGERTLCSIANLTRKDGEEFLELATKIPLRTEVKIYPLEKVNEAVEDLRHGKIKGTAVIQIS